MPALEPGNSNMIKHIVTLHRGENIYYIVSTAVNSIPVADTCQALVETPQPPLKES